eukprot:837268-Alexandrium_andersonii.AAC.1
MVHANAVGDDTDGIYTLVISGKDASASAAKLACLARWETANLARCIGQSALHSDWRLTSKGLRELN